jgi:uncharacterized protein (DUF1015 family)
MPRLFPFRGIIPAKDELERVVSKPYDKYTRQEIEHIVKENPSSFLNIVKPELAAGIKSNSSQEETLRKSRLKFKEFIEQGILLKADSPRFYLYRQTKPDFVYTGIIASISASDYSNGTIKIHEQTLSKKEEKLKDYLKVVGINAEPVMFTYPHQQEIDQLINRLCEEPPYIEFSFDDKKHTFWEVSEPKIIQNLELVFSHIEHVYVADGHHRSASSALLAEELAAQNEGAHDTPSSRFLGIFFPDHNLQLLEFNRLLKDTNSLSEQQILEKLSVDFTVELIQGDQFKPRMLHEISMYLAGHWYSLKLKFERLNEQLTEKLDANILSQTILNRVFGVKDLRVDSRIDFLNGLYDSSKLKELVDSGKFAVAFGLYPVSFEQFFAFSDAGYMMPPKTTWFEPKLLNGLIIYDLELED